MDVRTSILAALSIAFLIALPCLASIVIHDPDVGIVATGGNTELLDRFGQVWTTDPDWARWSAFDPPVPVDSIKFWEPRMIVTMQEVVWDYNAGAGGWRNLGRCPAFSGIDAMPSSTRSASLSPNPSPGPCRISFQAAMEGPITIEVIDVTGRILRHLLDGPHPAGDYSVIWDGRDDAGRELPSGTYWTRVLTTAGITAGRIVLSK
jgi:hypothetical protein